MAPLDTVLRSRYYTRWQTAKLDRLENLCARGVEEIKDQLLHIAGRLILSDTHTVVYTEA